MRLFGKDFQLKTRTGKIFPFEEHGSFFLRKILISTQSKICTLASGDRVRLWHKCLEHNYIEDSLRLKDNDRGLKISEDDVREL